jgi:hypothetical protein
MSHPNDQTGLLSVTPESAKRRAAPIIALLLLSPIVGEVLFGATRITTIFVLLPQIGTWGCAALLIREIVRRKRLGWTSVLLLGIALAIAEECLIQQTSLAPLPGVDPEHPYGRTLGVNWVYFLWAIGYESVWIVVLPIQLTELIFPAQRHDPWLKTRGVTISTIAFALSSFVAWYSWTQLYVPKFFPELAFKVPVSATVIASSSILVLAYVALGLQHPAQPRSEKTQRLPRPWLVGLAACILGLPWFGLVLLAYNAFPALPAVIPLMGGLALVVVAYALVRYWSRSNEWRDSSRLALISGGLTASMLAGFLIFKLGGAEPVDVVGKLILNVGAVWFLLRLTRIVSVRASST